jgi:hypothetical protein
MNADWIGAMAWLSPVKWLSLEGVAPLSDESECRDPNDYYFHAFRNPADGLLSEDESQLPLEALVLEIRKFALNNLANDLHFVYSGNAELDYMMPANQMQAAEQISKNLPRTN